MVSWNFLQGDQTLSWNILKTENILSLRREQVQFKFIRLMLIIFCVNGTTIQTLSALIIGCTKSQDGVLQRAKVKLPCRMGTTALLIEREKLKKKTWRCVF